eukprot:TRINITY_DN3651_c0_g1_i7.p1 TRINITY_DN3651_c0_g1~~TRINITY_DN3651_c0_g1_i7.p1  ORF type:complete len:659 (+),score=217.40 TRINITY_DN3651_c0_g1_i7:49-1977(+)
MCIRDRLVECKNKEVRTLSGGQKRKLSVGLSLIGDLSIIVLDEPTVGMDANSRQGLWKLILESKSNRLILLTTQNLAEADELSDRIAILNGGALFGKPLPAIEWKRKYGHGYKLLVESGDVREVQASGSLVRRHVADVAVNESGSKAEFLLPMGDLRKYKEVFRELEEKKELKVSLEYSSLEDAYLNIRELKNGKKAEETPQAPSKAKKESNNHSASPRPSMYKQFLGLLRLRFLLIRRGWSHWLESLVPLLLLFAGGIGYFSNKEANHSMLGYTVTSICYFFLTLAYANLLSATIYTPVHEKGSQLKYMLEVNSATGLPYWTSYILSEMCISAVMIAATHTILHILQLTTYKILGLSLILGTYSLVVTLWSCLISFLYENPARASSHGRQIYGMGPFLVQGVVAMFALPRYKELMATLDKVLSFTPVYGLYHTLSNFAAESFPDAVFIIEVLNFKKKEPGYIDSSAKGLQCLATSGLIALVGIALMEHRMKSRRVSKETHAIKKARPVVDSTLKRELAASEQSIMKFSEVAKVYPDGMEALKEVSFDVPKGSIFGILGPNGAGKSTLFNIATLQVRRTEGDILIEGKSIYSNFEGCNAITLCPQNNRYWNNLTVTEHLQFIAQLKGFSPSQASTQVLLAHP